MSEFCCSAALLAHDRSKKTDVGRSSKMLSDLFLAQGEEYVFGAFRLAVPLHSAVQQRC